ncbi:hypothetical protein L208DRAFT_411253 [Tricholoma matsutake]|nr:hypothetical protein L208DRAFT_411253 [Tricholoma matsutake 945]
MLGDAHSSAGIRSPTHCSTPSAARGTMLRTAVYEFCVLLPLTASLTWTIWDVLVFDHLIIETTSGSWVRFPHDSLRCMLLSSNKSSGFGPASTQEELITGTCPALLPFGALLVSPPVPGNAAPLTRRVVPMTAWQGQGRNARMIKSETEYIFSFLMPWSQTLSAIFKTSTHLWSWSILFQISF